MTVVDLNARRAPVIYTVTIAHHYTGTLEFCIADVADDQRSREAVMDAFRRISGAADRIEKLEAALLEIFDHECRTSSKSFIACVARDALWPQALEGKDD